MVANLKDRISLQHIFMTAHETYMQRCIQLALNGLGRVAPNPMVGCVIVYDGKIIGEGFHAKFGEAHAEVNAIQSVNDKSLLKHATLYVSLEPCSHFGKTPPCADLIIANNIPEVIIGSTDPFDAVNGSGISKLVAAGIKVTTGICENECAQLNKRFFTFHNKYRPYIILKWAESADGFMAPAGNDKITWISSEASRQLVHKWRSEEQAVMVGTNTALIDNPQLTVRNISGKNPVRIVIDGELKLPIHLNLFDKSTPTIVFTSKHKASEKNLDYILIHFNNHIVEQMLEHLYNLNIQSVIIEGGAMLFNSFIEKQLWDEARIFKSKTFLKSGLKAPSINTDASEKIKTGSDTLYIVTP